MDALPVTVIKGVGASLAATLAKLNIHTLQDLIFHLPFRYLDRTRITPIGQLDLHSNVVIQGQVLNAKVLFWQTPFPGRDLGRQHGQHHTSVLPF